MLNVPKLHPTVHIGEPDESRRALALLREAARQFYNATISAPGVRITASSEEQLRRIHRTERELRRLLEGKA